MEKIKIGFGPETTANSFYQSGVKVAEKLNQDGRFECGFFKESFDYESLSYFDVLIFIKICPSYDILKMLKNDRKALVLDYQDMVFFTNIYERNPVKKILKKILYFDLEKKKKERYRLFDRCIVASPGSEKIARDAGMTPYFLFRQVYNDRNFERPKIHTDKTERLTILWTGIGFNLCQNKPVEPILQKLCAKHNCRVIYLTKDVAEKDNYIEYKRWSIDMWENDLAEADIAFRWWLDSDNNQYCKDSNKIISYMAAALPVVCHPTLADKLVMTHGKTGFFAETTEKFALYIEKLIENPRLRKEVGEAAFREVWGKYSLNNHVEELKKVILDLAVEKQWDAD